MRALLCFAMCAALAMVSACGDDDRRGPTPDAGPGIDAGPGMDDAGGGCESAADCDDGVACTVDTCTAPTCSNVPDDAMCGAGQTCDRTSGCVGDITCTADADCADMDPCTVAERCELATGDCLTDALDEDGDGVAPPSCGGGDCDDTNPVVAPGRSELCDGLDNDCDGAVDGVDADPSCGVDGVCDPGGTCSCLMGRTLCGGTCVDLTGDPMHCGACGVSCGMTGTCAASACTCPTMGETFCAGGCVDFDSDPMHCGACGAACLAGQVCVAGLCTAACDVGLACTAAMACPTGMCQMEAPDSIGGAMDPITGYPPGTTTPLSTPEFPGGYCTPNLRGPEGAPGSCDPTVMGGCGACGVCTTVDTVMGVDQTMCLRSCIPNTTNRSGCRRGYQCALTAGVCFRGCGSDDECRVQREDTNMDGTLDPYDPMTNPMGDRLVYDTTSAATCSPATGRCENPGTAGARAGDACMRDSQCERNGDCIVGWPGGYCTRFGCTVGGVVCAGPGTLCQTRRIGVDICVRGCTVAAEPMADQLGPMGRGAGCRVGYQCAWGGRLGAGVAGNGACIPGNYNAVTVSNVGAPCTSDDQCYSPFGAGACLSAGAFGPAGYCSIIDCGAAGMPPGVCGAGSQCLAAFTGMVTGCFLSCTTAAECNAGHACIDFDGSAITPRVCFPICLSSADCRTGQTCVIPPGMMSGTCV